MAAKQPVQPCQNNSQRRVSYLKVESVLLSSSKEVAVCTFCVDGVSNILACTCICGCGTVLNQRRTPLFVSVLFL